MIKSLMLFQWGGCSRSASWASHLSSAHHLRGRRTQVDSDAAATRTRRHQGLLCVPSCPSLPGDRARIVPPFLRFQFPFSVTYSSPHSVILLSLLECRGNLASSVLVSHEQNQTNAIFFFSIHPDHLGNWKLALDKFVYFLYVLLLSYPGH